MVLELVNLGRAGPPPPWVDARRALTIGVLCARCSIYLTSARSKKKKKSGDLECSGFEKVYVGAGLARRVERDGERLVVMDQGFWEMVSEWVDNRVGDDRQPPTTISI